MSFRDFGRQLMQKISAGGDNPARRQDGGTSCYRPNRKRAQTDQPAPGPVQATAAAMESYIHSGFTGMNPPEPWGPLTGKASPAVPDNISYMPGVAEEPADPFRVHILTMTGLKSCYDAIEFMKNGETLIVMMDTIGNDGEILRCQDMIAGAAFTLGCNIRLLQGSRMILIAPNHVQVLPEEPRRAPVMPVMNQAPAQEAPQGRVRRSVQNEGRWQESSRLNRTAFNPYTGQMPVAAGSYANFGGYGV